MAWIIFIMKFNFKSAPSFYSIIIEVVTQYNRAVRAPTYTDKNSDLIILNYHNAFALQGWPYKH